MRAVATSRPPDPSQLPLGGDFISLGDGSFKFTPRKPLLEYSVQAAAKFLGVSDDTVRGMIELVDEEDQPVLDVNRPSPRKTKITWESLARHKQNSKDPEYWDRLRRKNRFSAFFFRK